MKAIEFVELLNSSCRRFHLIGDLENGVIAVLDMEGRLFTIINGEVISRVLPASVIKHSDKNGFQNPGGDALWPAPEGTSMGYEYPTGQWRVPPSISGAAWRVISHNNKSAIIRAEIDLINNRQTGIPCEFERRIHIDAGDNFLIQHITEMIRYIGKVTFTKDEFSLAPWSLCQFDSGPGDEVIIPLPGEKDVWDLYECSASQRRIEKDRLIVNANTDKKFQLAFSKNVEWIEFVSSKNFSVKRYAKPLPSGQHYIDIGDVPPSQMPTNNGVSLSVYCDPSGFMEIEACGGCPDVLSPGTEMSVEVVTEYAVRQAEKAPKDQSAVKAAEVIG